MFDFTFRVIHFSHSRILNRYLKLVYFLKATQITKLGVQLSETDLPLQSELLFQDCGQTRVVYIFPYTYWSSINKVDFIKKGRPTTASPEEAQIAL